MVSRDNLYMLLLGLSALLQGVWPKTTLLSKACHDLLVYGTCGPYHNFSTCGDKWATSPHCFVVEHIECYFGCLYSQARGSWRCRKLTVSTSWQRLRQLFSFQLLIVDGQELRHNPASVMDNIQKFLGVTPLFNYTQALR